MLQGTKFIIVGSEKWISGNQTSKHHLILQFLKMGASVLYLENISMRRIGSGGSSDIGKARKILKAIFDGVQHPLRNLITYTPLYIPYPKSAAVRTMNSWFIAAQIRILQRRYKFNKPVYLYFVPTGEILTGKLNQQLSIYYIVDNFAAFDGIENDTVRLLENRALKSADLVFATAQTIIERLAISRKNILHSPHGVDVEHFQSTQNAETQLPAELSDVPRPIIGFMGSLAHDSIDIDLLARLAKRRPDWTFLLLGRQSSDVEALRQYPNIKLVEAKPYKEMPAWLKAFDVALMPFLQNELTRDLNPIKLREYLASGIPIVSTRLPAIVPYGNVISFAHSDDEWEAAIENYLHNLGSIEARQKSVQHETWEARAKTVAEVIQTALNNR